MAANVLNNLKCEDGGSVSNQEVCNCLPDYKV
jgi:hypothetical protein